MITPNKLNRQLEDILGVSRANKMLMHIEKQAELKASAYQKSLGFKGVPEVLYHRVEQHEFYKMLTDELLNEIDKYKPFTQEQLDMEFPPHVDTKQMYIKGL